MKRIMIPAALALGLLTAGCVVHGRTSVHARASTPDLVYVSPGVQVVYDYHEPVFYSDGYYWRYYGGVWYRSGYYNRGWVRVRTVPVAVRRVDRPHTYVRYRGNARVDHRPADRRPAVRDHRHRNERVRAQPGVRDHRSAPAARPQQRGPAVRDHRTAPQRDDRRAKDKKKKDSRRDSRVRDR